MEVVREHLQALDLALVGEEGGEELARADLRVRKGRLEEGL